MKLLKYLKIPGVGKEFRNNKGRQGKQLKKISGTTVYDGKIIKVQRDEVLMDNGQRTVREVVRHRMASAVVALDNKGNIILVEQFRYPVGKKLLELPAGLVDDGETPKDAAIREFEEETGQGASHWVDLGDFYPAVGCHDEKIYLFFCSGIYEKGKQSLDGDEQLTVIRIPVNDVKRMITEGKIKDSKTIIGILFAEKRGLLKT